MVCLPLLFKTFGVCALLALLSPALAAEPAPNWLLPDADQRTVAFYDHADGRPAMLVFESGRCDSHCTEQLSAWVRAAPQPAVAVYWLHMGRTAKSVHEQALQLFSAFSVARQYGAAREARVVLISRTREKVWSGPAHSEPDEILRQWQAAWLAGAAD